MPLQKAMRNGNIMHWNVFLKEISNEKMFFSSFAKEGSLKSILDKPWPSALFLGWIGDQPLHVVAAYSKHAQKVAIITVYEPSLEYFEEDFRTRRKKNV